MYLIIPPVSFSELRDEPLSDELSRLRKLGVDDGNQGSVDVGKDGRGSLSLDDGAGKEATSTYNILLEKLTDYVPNVGHIHLQMGSHRDNTGVLCCEAISVSIIEALQVHAWFMHVCGLFAVGQLAVSSSHLVDETVDRFLECFPGQSLVGHRALVCYALLHHPETSRGDVGPTRPC